MSDAEFFVAEAVRHARQEMTFAEGLRFLDGLVKLAGDADEVHKLRQILIGVGAGDTQLELIAARQLRLDLTAKGERP